ncbi:unnamed protein product [Merluccius merluccius]
MEQSGRALTCGLVEVGRDEEQLFHFIHGTAIHHFRGWKRCGCRDEGAFLSWFNLADMKGGVGAERSGQAKAGPQQDR